MRTFDKPKRRRDWSKLWIALAVAVVIGIIVMMSVLYFSSIRTETGCVVESKERTVNVSSSTDSKGNTSTTTTQAKLVYTSCGVFTVDDNLFLLKFNSADTYGSLGEDETFDLEVIGWRNGFFSWFPNVLSAEQTS
jgi:hypothetical protein